MSPRTSAKRSPAGSKPWTRRLNLGGPAAPARAPTAAGSSTISPDQAGAELGASSTTGKAEGGNDTTTDVTRSDTFNLTALAKELDEIAAAQAAPPTFTSKFFASAHSLKAPVKAPTRINDLPDEILLRIFGFCESTRSSNCSRTRQRLSKQYNSLFLDLQWMISLGTERVRLAFPASPNGPLRRSGSLASASVGFRCVSRRSTPKYRTVTLTDTKILPHPQLARYLCYRSMRIAHLSRISALHRAFTLNPELATHVRHLVIEFPATSAKDLEQVVDAPVKVGQPGSGREPDSEADSQSRPATPSSTDETTASDSPTRSVKKKKKAIPPPTYADQLRSVFQSCAFLLSLEIVGIPPATLFAASSAGTTSSIHRLHQLRLSTVASLTLRASDDAEPLKAVALRDALLALTGLRRLALKGYASALDDEETDKLDFSPTKTSLGLVARPLPTRTRSSRLLPLERLELVECSFSRADLEALLRHCRPKILRRLAVEDRYTSARARQLRELGFSHTPTVEALSTVVNLIKDSVVSLKVSLYNYPLLVGGEASFAMQSGNSSTAPQSGSMSRRVTGKTRPPPHVLDDFVAQLEHLQVLDVGGTVLTPALFEANADASRPSSMSTKQLPARLPSTVRALTIRACPLLTPPALLPFLTSLGPLPSRLRDPNSTISRLAILNTVGGSEHGWSRSTNTWAIQQACWAAGVKWSSGASSAVTPGDGHIAEIDSPKFWVQGYGPASRTGGVW